MYINMYNLSNTLLADTTCICYLAADIYIWMLHSGNGKNWTKTFMYKTFVEL